MADITYGVNVEYLTSGSVNAPSSGLDKTLTSLKGMEGVVKGLSGMLDGVISGIASVGVAAAEGLGAALAGGMALALHQAVEFNKEMEDAQTGLATMADAATGLNGFLDPREAFGNQYRLAGDVIKQMRKDAQELPGEFKDLQNIMSALAPAGDAAGMSMMGMEKMSAEAMLAASASHVPLEQVGRQMAAAINGTVTNRMRTFTSMNIKDDKGNSVSAKDFNKLDQKTRIRYLNEGLARINSSGAKDSVMQNWSTISSNFVDNLKIGVGIVGGPLLSRVKDAMKEFNSSDKTHFADFGAKVGQGLVNAFDYADSAIRRWGPLMINFGRNLYQSVENAFGLIAPYINDAKYALLDLFTHGSPKALIGDILGGLAVAKGGMMGVEGGIGLAKTIGPMLAPLGLGATEIGMAALVAAPAIAILGASVAGAVDIITDTTNSLHDFAMTQLSGIKDNALESGRALKDLGETVKPIMDVMGADLLLSLNLISTAITAVTTGMDSFYNALIGATSYLLKLNLGIGGAKLNGDDFEDLAAGRTTPLNPQRYFDAHAEREKAAKPPSNTTHIHKIEIKVNSNQDPSRIAKHVVGLIREEARNPRSAAINPAGRFNTQG